MIIGIDLGTTNSLAAVWQDGKAVIVPNALGQSLTPSCVGLLDDGSMIVGEAAKERLQTHPLQTAALFKRYMGTDRNIKLSDKSFRPEELSSFVLRSLKADAEAYLGKPVTEAIITVPAYFNDAQRKATRNAGELAGLRVERLLNEPTAAAMAYGLQNNDEKKFLVFDLGGGTFDISVLELFEGIMEVRASAGDNFLGGEDFVTLLMTTFLDRTGLAKTLGSPHPNDLRPHLLQSLHAVAERAKCVLSEHIETKLQLEVDQQLHSWVISQEEFLALSQPLLDRLRQPIERALRDARIPPAELDSIILAGGATRMPIVRKMVGRMFGRFPVVDLNPDELIALGAAIQAGLKMRDAALDEVVMTDVSPYSMGIEVSRQVGNNQITHGYFSPIIERNCAVPISRVTRVQTVVDNQTSLLVRVFQGESPLVADNIFLGELKIPIPPRPAGDVELDVRFTYDVNGLLEAEAIVVKTGTVHSLVIQENPGVMTQEEIQERLKILASIKIHPRDQTANRTVLARAERLYQQTLGPVRSALGDVIALFQAALDLQDEERIRKVRVSTQHLLDQVDSGSVLL